MFSKSILAAAVLAGASAVTAYEHPTHHGPGGHHPCKTTSTVIVYETETATVYEAAETGGWVAGGSNVGAGPTYGGGAPAGHPTVTVTATVSYDAAGNEWGVGGGSGSSTVDSGNGGHGGGYGSSEASATATAGSGNGGHGGGYGGGSATASSTAGSGGNGGYGGGYGSGSATATVTAGSGPTGAPSSLCLTNATATYLTNGYGQLLSAYTNATANSLLAADFTDTSDSINWLAGIPLGGPTFGSKAAFIAGQGTQPPIGFSVTSIMYSCTQVAFRWTATVGLKKWPAKGINMFTASNLNNTAAGWQIETMYSEFDVGAWETDIGRTCSPQGANIAGSA